MWTSASRTGQPGPARLRRWALASQYDGLQIPDGLFEARAGVEDSCALSSQGGKEGGSRPEEEEFSGGTDRQWQFEDDPKREARHRAGQDGCADLATACIRERGQSDFPIALLLPPKRGYSDGDLAPLLWAREVLEVRRCIDREFEHGIEPGSCCQWAKLRILREGAVDWVQRLPEATIRKPRGWDAGFRSGRRYFVNMAASRAQYLSVMCPEPILTLASVQHRPAYYGGGSSTHSGFIYGTFWHNRNTKSGRRTRFRLAGRFS